MNLRQRFFEGFAAGVTGFRLVGTHSVPTSHPHGSTPEGREWFLGFVTALECCHATIFGAKAPQKKEASIRLAPDRGNEQAA